MIDLTQPWCQLSVRDYIAMERTVAYTSSFLQMLVTGVGVYFVKQWWDRRKKKQPIPDVEMPDQCLNFYPGATPADLGFVCTLVPKHDLPHMCQIKGQTVAVWEIPSGTAAEYGQQCFNQNPELRYSHYLCTLPVGHQGPHVHETSDHKPVVTW